MAEYFYKAITNTGQVVEGFLEGKDEKTIVRNLQDQGYIPVRVVSRQRTLKKWRLPSFPSGRRRISNLLTFTQELATLISAGLPLDRSLDILASLTPDLRMQEILRDVLARIRGGSSLGEALANHPQVFPNLYINMVKAGEVGGFLETIFMRLVQYLQRVKEIKEYLISILIYPVILTAVSAVSITILVAFVIPRFSRLFADLGQAIPLPTQMVLVGSQYFRDYWWLGIVLIGFFYICLKAYIQGEERRWRWDRFKLSWPAFGSLIKKIEVARFSRTLGTLLQSGVPILSALSLVREVSQNQAVAKAIDYVQERLREGKGMARALKEIQIFPALAVHMIEVGEETGKLEEMLHKVATSYEESIQNTTKRLVSLLEPLIILVMGLIIGFIVISMLLAVFSLQEIPF